jgi:stage II sporulation protein R
MNKIFSNVKSIDDARTKANENIDGIKSVVAETLRNSGYSDDFAVYFDTFCFPAKNYGDITLPSGKYEAIKIVLGSGKGKNWWCVMFPPLCFTDISTGIVPSSSKIQLQNTLSNDSFQLICSDPEVEFRFKVVDFVNSIL